MRKTLFMVVFLSSGILFPNQLTSLEQLNSSNAEQNFPQYFSAIGTQRVPLVKRLVADIYNAELPIHERLTARRLLDEVFDSIKSSVITEWDGLVAVSSIRLNLPVLEMRMLLRHQHWRLIKEEPDSTGQEGLKLWMDWINSL